MLKKKNLALITAPSYTHHTRRRQNCASRNRERGNYRENCWHLTSIWWAEVIWSYLNPSLPQPWWKDHDCTLPDGPEWGDGGAFPAVNIHLSVTTFSPRRRVGSGGNSTWRWIRRVAPWRRADGSVIHQPERVLKWKRWGRFCITLNAAACYGMITP